MVDKCYGDARFFRDFDDFNECYALAEDEYYWLHGSRECFHYAVGVVFQIVDEKDLQDVINDKADRPIRIHNIIKLGFAFIDGDNIKVQVADDSTGYTTVYVFRIVQGNLVDISDNDGLCWDLARGQRVFIKNGKMYNKI